MPAKNYFPRMDKKMEPFSLNDLVRALPLPNKHKRDIRELKRTIDKEKDIVAHFIRANQIQVKKHLAVMDNIMELIGHNGTQARYTGNGMVTRKKKEQLPVRGPGLGTLLKLLDGNKVDAGAAYEYNKDTYDHEFKSQFAQSASPLLNSTA